MVDGWLIALAVIVPVMILALSLYMVVYYQHPDDKNTAWWPKTLVVLSLSLAMFSVFMIPFDVANQAGSVGCGTFGQCGGLYLNWVWQVLYVLIAVFVMFLIPFTIFFYESYELDRGVCRQGCSALGWQVASSVIAIMVLVIMWVYLKFADIPVATFTLSGASSYASCDFLSTEGQLLQPDPSLSESCEGGLLTFNQSEPHIITATNWRMPTSTSGTVTIPTTFMVFLTCMLTFVGWFLFVLYAGIGLVALPYDMIQAYIHRPQYLPKDVYEKTRKGLAERTKELVEIGESMKTEVHHLNEGKHKRGSFFSTIGRNREAKKAHTQFKQAVLELRDQHEGLELSYNHWKNYNPVVYWAKLAGGILCAILSFLWILHIILYMLARTPYPNGFPVSYFLNDMMSWGSKASGFPLLGVIFVGLFAFELLFCVMKGNVKFGLRFLIVEIHPMKYGATFMSSFLFNCSLVLLCVPPLIQFTSAAFGDYVVLTDVDTIFGQQIRYMRFFVYFFANNVFVIAMMIISFLTFIWMFFVPSKSVREAKAIRARIDAFKSTVAEKEATLEAAASKKAKSPSKSVELPKISEANEDDNMEIQVQ